MFLIEGTPFIIEVLKYKRGWVCGSRCLKKFLIFILECWKFVEIGVYSKIANKLIDGFFETFD